MCSISTTTVRLVKSIKYFWRTNGEGEPIPIFARITGDCGSDNSGFWPISGVAVLPSLGCEPSRLNNFCRVRLIIVGKLICRGVATTNVGTATYSRQSAPTALSFRHLTTVIVVVSNPYDEPDSWEYQFRVFPRYQIICFILSFIRVFKFLSFFLFVLQFFPHSFDLTAVSTSSKVSNFVRHSEDAFLLATMSDPSTSSSSSSQQVVLRVPASELMVFNFSSLHILSGSESMGGKVALWQSLSSAPAPLIKPVVVYAPGSTEASLHFDRELNRWVIVCMLSMERLIRACRTTEEDMESGWQCFVLTEVDSKWAQIGSIFSYAGRAHPSLMNAQSSIPDNLKDKNALHAGAGATKSTSGNDTFGATTMVISFVPNALKDVKSLFDEVYFSLYTPKFLYVVST